jgi:rhamnosyl/mannosyltransferase
MPSHLRSEAFGLSQIEAMACGLPVVSTNIRSGVPYVNKNGVSGITVPPANPVALAEAINRLIADDKLRRVLGTGAWERAHEKFSAARMCQNLELVYRQALSGNSGRRELS